MKKIITSLLFTFLVVSVFGQQIPPSGALLDADGNLSSNKSITYTMGAIRPSAKINAPSVPSCTPVFFDGFESGNYTPTWTNNNANFTPSVISTDPAIGTYSLYGVSPTGLSHYSGLSTTFSAATPDEISWYIKPEGNRYTNYFVVGDNNIASNNGILFCYWYGITSSIRFFNGEGYDFPATPGSWYFIQAKNIDWVNHQMDIYINNELKLSNFAFRNPLNSITQVHIYNFSDGNANWDHIALGCSPGGCTPPSPPIASMANQTNICSGTSTSLAATCGSGDVKWYDATGTTLLFTGSPFITPTLASDITYKVRCGEGSCVSTFTDVVITVKPTPTSALSASKLDVCPNTEVSLNANCSEAGSTVNWNPGGATVTPNAPDVAYTYKASCTLNGCTGNESSVVVRTHRILVDLKDVGLGAQPKAIIGAIKDNLAPTNAISAAVSPRLWTILATGCSASESAVFKLTGPVSFSSIDNNPPYAIFANVGTTYFSIDHPNYGNGGSSFPNGIYNLVVDLRSADGVGGPFPKNRIATGSLLATRSLQFTVATGSPRLGIEDLSLEELNWASVFQNPVSEEIVVRISGTVGEEVSLGLVNLQGQTVQGRQVKLSSPQQYEVLNVRQQNAGMYILKAIKGDKVKTIKVVKAE